MSGKRLLLILLASTTLSLAACSNNDNPIITSTNDLTIPNNNQAQALVIEPSAVTLAVGQTTKVASLFNQDGEIRRNLPTEWISLDPEIITIDGEGNITALKPGNVQIMAKTLGQEAQALVSVSAAVAGTETPNPSPSTPGFETGEEGSETSPELAKLRTIVIRPENESVQPTLFKFSRLGEQRTFVAVGKDSEGQEIKNLTFSWSSSDEAIATVNSTGVVDAVATGTSNLIASAGNVTSNIVQIQVQEGTIRAHIRFTE